MFKRADLKLGYSCNANCTFCVVGDKLYSGDRSTEEVCQDMDDAVKTCEGIVFTGGEPTMRKDFLSLVAYARKVGFRSIQIQTNGKMLSYLPFCVRTIKAGATEFSPAIHGHNVRLHDSLVRTPGSFNQVYQSIVNLKLLKQRVITNTVITRQNAPHLPDIARMLVQLKVDQFQMAFVHPVGYVPRYHDQLVPRISEIRPFIHEAMSIGNAAGIKCMAEAVPYCQMAGHEQNVSELYIPPTEIHYGEYVVPDYKSDRLESGKKRFPQCRQCKWEYICEGPWREYPENFGHEEFQPVSGAKIFDGLLVQEGMSHLLGTPAKPFSLPDAQGETVRLPDYAGQHVLVYFYPEDGSPGCTAEACSLRDHSEALIAEGVEVLGISPDSSESHQAFARNLGLPFKLLSDRGGEICREYGVMADGRFRRWSFLIAPDQTLQHIFLDVRPDIHAQEVLHIAALAREAYGLAEKDKLMVNS